MDDIRGVIADRLKQFTETRAVDTSRESSNGPVGRMRR
jgi:hypothetical protein